MYVAPDDPAIADESPLFFESYGGLVNQQTFQTKGLLSFEGWQYAAWYTSTRYAVVARRPFGGLWETYQLDHQLSVDDSHNTIALGISGDGRIHIALDCHSTPACFAVSEPGLAGTDEPWTFGPVGSLLGELDLGPISYPSFVTTPTGELQLFYRVGGSNNGALWLAEYNGSWTVLGAITTPSGSYSVTWPTGGTKTSSARNFYPHGIVYDASGRLHMAGTWRESSAVCQPGGIPNRDIAYVYSDDRGRTWKNQAGTPVATTGVTQFGTSSGCTVFTIPPFYALMNQESMAVDSTGRVHLALSYVPGRFTNAWATKQVTDAEAQRPVYGRLFHLRQTPTGWVNTELAPGGDYPLGAYGRTQIVLTDNDDVLMVMPKLRILGATAATGYTDWAVKYDIFGECLVDYSAGVLSVAHQLVDGGALLIKDFEVG